jgi:ABC-2 type transport system permease protein
MSKTVRVLLHEIYMLVSRFSFWFGSVGVPVIAFLIYAAVGTMNQGSGTNQFVSQALSGIFATEQDSRPEGYVDEGGLVQVLPPTMSPDRLVAYASESEARQALEEGTIKSIYVISPNYLETGEMTFVVATFTTTALDNTDLMEYVLEYNLLGGDAELLRKVSAPMELDEMNLSPETVRDQDNPLTFFLPYAVTLLFYIMILGSATLLLNSIGKEKENRVIEILMASLSPRQLLTGKMVGLGLIGLFQIVLWGGTAFVMLRLSGRTFSLPPEFQLPTEILVWGLVYFVLGYSLYGAFMSGLGALVPNLREASQATIIIIAPMIIPLMLISVLIEDPNGWLAVGLSLFPLTSPITMMLRLAATTVPPWQNLLAIALLIGSVILAMRAAAGMFRAQSLLSGQTFKVKTFLLALVGRA